MTDQTPDPKDPIGSDLVREDASFTNIVLQFVEGLSQRLDTMDRAIHLSDFEALRIAAQQLKGSGGGYGYPIVSERAAELETCARAGLVDECTQALNQLRTVCERLIVQEDQA